MIGKNLKKLRKDKKLSVYDLSQKTHISTSYIYQLERGDKKYPSIESLKKIATALGVEIWELTSNNKDIDAIKKSKDILKNFNPNDPKTISNEYEKALIGFKNLLTYHSIPNWTNFNDIQLMNIVDSKMFHDFLTNMIDVYSKLFIKND